MNLFNHFLGKYTSVDNKKLLSVEDNANKYSLPEATSSILGGVKANDLKLTDSSGNVNKVMGYNDNTLSLDKSKVLELLTLSQIGNNSSTVTNTEYLSINLTWNYPKKVLHIGTVPNADSNWTLTDLIVYQPLFLLRRAQSGSTSSGCNGTIRIVSGAIGGRNVVHRLAGGSRWNNAFITIPISTTVVIYSSGAQDDEYIEVYQ